MIDSNIWHFFRSRVWFSSTFGRNLIQKKKKVWQFFSNPFRHFSPFCENKI